jgi:hypothetical protein
VAKAADGGKIADLAAALAFIKDNHGQGVLLDGEKLGAFLNDYWPKGKQERNVLRNAFALSIPKKLAEAAAKDLTEQAVVMGRCVEMIEDSYGTGRNVAETHLWAFAEALGWSGRPEPQAAPSPTPQLAPSPTPQPAQTQAAPTVGGVIPVAGYDWRVLEVKGGKALLISEKVLENRPYNDKFKRTTWAECTLRAYLNHDFFNSLGSDNARISETQVVNRDNPIKGAPGGADTTDKIFLLSIEEAEAYFKDNDAWIAYDFNGEALTWWLRSPGYDSVNAVAVNSGGGFSAIGYVSSDNRGVRPALWLNL